MVLIRYLSAKIPYQRPITWLSPGLRMARYRRQCRAAYVCGAAGFGAKLNGRPTARGNGGHFVPQFIAKMSALKTTAARTS